MLSSLPEATVSGLVVGAMPGAEGQMISGAVLQATAPARDGLDVSADQETLATAASVIHTQGGAVSGTSETAQPRAGEQRMSLRADEGMSDDQGGADQKAPPFPQASGEEAPVSEERDSTTRSSEAAGSSSIIAKNEAFVGPMAGRPGPVVWEAPGLSEAAAPVEPAGLQHPLVNSLGLQGPSLRNQEGGKAAVGEPHQAGPASEAAGSQRERFLSATADSMTAGDRPSDVVLSELQADHRLQVDVRQGHEPAMSGGNVGETVAQRPETAASVGQFTQSSSSETDRHGGAASTVSQSSGRVHVPDSPLPVMSRSVVLEVAQPDLGRVNIRVALTNDFVHTHLSSDRLEVGQYLLSSQDRLQSAFQTNGLEMGQFRVDIDRQSAGRSFQHGQSQDQGRMWQPEQTGSEQHHGAAEPRTQHTRGYAGKLNLVA
jgi:flagellar hook-length control protein FliK